MITSDLIVETGDYLKENPNENLKLFATLYYLSSSKRSCVEHVRVDSWLPIAFREDSLIPILARKYWDVEKKEEECKLDTKRN